MTSTFTDTRDGNVYKTINLNGQVWLAENLRYKGVKYYAPNGDENNIAVYGCLYTGLVAENACPEGWRLPSVNDLEELLTISGSNPVECFKNLSALSCGGDNKLGFKALLPGSLRTPNCYEGFNDYGGLWSITEGNSYGYFRLDLSHLGAYIFEDYDDNAFSVRCVKD